MTEEEVEEIIEQFIMKLGMVKLGGRGEYNELLCGDSSWVSECMGGVGIEGGGMVSKKSLGLLH